MQKYTTNLALTFHSLMLETKMEEVTEQHLLKTDENIVWPVGETFSQITVAFLSSRIQETDCQFSSLYVLATLTRGPDDALVSLR